MASEEQAHLPITAISQDWTDAEWLRLISELPPSTDVAIAAQKVRQWRAAAEVDDD